jgi:hypothetical protein
MMNYGSSILNCGCCRLERAAIDARGREADRERAQRNTKLERDLSSYRERPRVSSALELNHITVLDPEAPLPHDAWLQPADRLAPMPEEQRMRMWCVTMIASSIQCRKFYTVIHFLGTFRGD